MANFSAETRFDFDQHQVIKRLLTVATTGRRSSPAAENRRYFVHHLRQSLAALARLTLPNTYRRRSPADGLSQFCALVDQLTGHPLIVEDAGTILQFTHGAEQWTYPASRERLLVFAFQTAVDPASWFGAKYTLPGFVELAPADVVIDCGAFAGGFTRAALRAGASVAAVEPSRTNQRCLEANLRGLDVDIHRVGLGPTVQRAVFHESSTGVDSSFGKIDQGNQTATYEVEILTVDELCRRSGVQPTFLKVEAEGMESSILAGMEEVRPAKVVIDASPEGGSDDRDAIAKRLKALGYTIRTDLNMIYSRL